MKEATLAQILDNREARAARQEALRREFQCPILSFTMNIAGPVKVSALIQRAFREGLGWIFQRIPEDAILHREVKVEITGCEALFAVRMDARELKDICTDMEEAAPLGRLFDLDVIDESGVKLSRAVQRCCLICGAPGRGCSARRVHSVKELQETTRQIISRHFAHIDAAKIGAIAKESLLEEVLATPKPGLVDRRNSGSHRDMDVETFVNSAEALEGYFVRCVKIGQETADLPEDVAFSRLREAGISAEEDMYRATGGVNTHKGAIYSLGVICGALGRLWSAEGAAIPMDRLFSLCSALAGPAAAADFAGNGTDTAGMRWYLAQGVTGIRGEVASGFPSLAEIALPRFAFAAKNGLSREEAGIYALLHLIPAMDDTTLLHRGGVEGAGWAKAAVGNLLDSAQFPTRADIERLDDAFIARNLSPGGAADLLALTFFLTTLTEYGFLA